jgi:hypothetical protein
LKLKKKEAMKWLKKNNSKKMKKYNNYLLNNLIQLQHKKKLYFIKVMIIKKLNTKSLIINQSNKTEKFVQNLYNLNREKMLKLNWKVISSLVIKIKSKL